MEVDMITALKWSLPIIFISLATQMALADSASGKRAAAVEHGRTVVAVALKAKNERGAVVEPPEARTEILVQKAQKRTRACAVEVAAILDQAFDLIFKEPDFP